MFYLGDALRWDNNVRLVVLWIFTIAHTIVNHAIVGVIGAPREQFAYLAPGFNEILNSADPTLLFVAPGIASTAYTTFMSWSQWLNHWEYALAVVYVFVALREEMWAVVRAMSQSFRDDTGGFTDMPDPTVPRRQQENVGGLSRFWDWTAWWHGFIRDEAYDGVEKAAKKVFQSLIHLRRR